MKIRILIIASIWTIVFSAALPVNAQAGGVKVNVPFDFAVSDKLFRAGEYTMFEAPLGVSVQDEHGVTVAMALANNVTGRSVGKRGQIVFHCYNEQRCFLSELWSPSHSSGRELLMSGRESDLAKESERKELALVGVAE